MVDELLSRAEAVLGRVEAVLSKWWIWYRKVMDDVLDRVLRRTPKTIRGMEHFYEDRLERVRIAHHGEEKDLRRLYCGLLICKRGS